VLTAKQLATLSALTGGRVIVGVGVGWLEEEFRILGAGDAFSARGAVTDDYLGLYRALWSPDPVEFEGAHYRLPGAYASPKPPAAPPIWVGGNTRPALRRTARMGDGWHAIRMGVEDLRQGVAFLHEQLRAVGRSPAAVLVSLRGALHFDRPQTQEWELGPSATQVAAQMEHYRQAGVQAFVFSPPPGSSLAQAIEVAERFMSEVRPKLGE
jgi:alkanesulfonate monooxygenase SsuD/methylene tetrahydromethanopterin reductase-like flavin-dependent oxidoreductase (luciferase family)